ncbi:DNA polymerase III subunit alpha [Gemella cuniculi]|uniref:DNA polymerase III subunit alpha n=1 Tax=Gemella cuniculi TaxID=150240 RepID=UPI0003F8410A|nr:DNA polymerase III subunit alpha [Gemella cuniculi]
MTYYNLQVHSAYDLLNSTIKIDELFSKLKKDNQQAVVITDPNMYAAIKAEKQAQKTNIKLIHALEVKLGYGINFLNFNILCKNSKMFYKLLEISTKIASQKEMLLENFLIDMQDYKDDFTIILVDELRDSMEFSYLMQLLEGFNFYFGFNENFDYSLYQYYENTVYTRPSYYLNKDNYQQVVVSRAIRDNSKLNIRELTATIGDDFVKIQSDFKELLDTIENKDYRCVLKKSLEQQESIIKYSNYKLDFTSYHLPKYVFGSNEDIYNNLTSKEYLHYLVQKGAKEKLEGKDPYIYKRRYDYELKIIDEMGFNDYFLIVYDFVKYAKDNGILVGAGRGSAAGSLVCYLLNITEADPLEFNLLFERFLNKERISMPDIDIDFQDTRRDEVIKYVEEKYGEDKVAQIITFTTFQSKSAARESARILQFSDETLKFISSNISSTRTLRECYEISESLRNFVNSSNQNRRWFKVALSLENLPKNPSVHAAGVVISDHNPLINYTPLAVSNMTKYITQWTMDDIENVGLLKIDFLGIRYLTMVSNIVSAIRKENPDFDINAIDYKDKNVYNLFAEGRTEGIFQFESSGMKEKLRLLKPTEFNDIVAMNALYRPGPMAQIETYVRRKHGLEKVNYPHVNLEKILKDTYGVIVYQEQIMLIAVNFAHMTLNEADNMRRAVSKKKKEDLEYYGKIFIEKSVLAGYNIDTAKKLFDLIVTFANYGFNKSHAVVYSMLAYRLAYLKVYYTKYFMTALLNNVINSEKKINEYKQELTNLGIRLVKPDINVSLGEFSVYKNDIVFALVAIKNVGYRSSYEIVQDRLKFGKYTDIDDFLKRMNKKVDYQAAVSLIKAGALDSFGYNRATLIKKVKDYYEDTRQYINNVRVALSAESGLTLKVEEIEDYPIQEKIKMEKEVTGTYFLKHPVQVEKERYSYLPLQYIGRELADSYVEIITKKEIKTKNGDYMAFLTVNDGKNDYDVTVFPSVYKYANTFIKVGKFAVMTLKKQLRNNREQYILEKITNLKNYNEYCLNNIKIIYIISDKKIVSLIDKYKSDSSGIKVISLLNNTSTQGVTTFIKNEQDFVHKFLEQFSRNRIKIAYTEE